MKIIILLAIFVFSSSILHSNDGITEIPLPFDATSNLFIHRNLIVAYRQDGLPLLWDPAEKRVQSRKIRKTHWDVIFDRTREEVVFCKPNGRKRYLSLKRQDGDGSVNVEASILSEDRFFVYYWDGVVKAWDISRRDVEELWSARLKKAKYGFAELSMSLDKAQIIVLNKPEERSLRPFGACAVLDAKTGEINFDTIGEIGNTDFVFLPHSPLSLLLNGGQNGGELFNLRLSTGEVQPIALEQKPASFYGSFQGPLDTLLLLDKTRSAMYVYKYSFDPAISPQARYTFRKTITAKLPDAIMHAGASNKNGHINPYLLLGDGERIHTLKFINLFAEDEFSIPLHTLNNYSSQKALFRHLGSGAIAPHFSESNELVFWGNCIADIKRKKVIHTFDNFVEDGEFFAIDGRQFFLCLEWPSDPSSKPVYKLLELPSSIYQPRMNEFFGIFP